MAGEFMVSRDEKLAVSPDGIRLVAVPTGIAGCAGCALSRPGAGGCLVRDGGYPVKKCVISSRKDGRLIHWKEVP